MSRFKRITLEYVYEVKPICHLGNNVVIDGDVIFTRDPVGMYIGDFTHVYKVNGMNVTIMNTIQGCRVSNFKPLKLKILWFWHMVILRKSHVYLTGVNK